MFENVQFFSHLHFKIAKSAIMTQKILQKVKSYFFAYIYHSPCDSY